MIKKYGQVVITEDRVEVSGFLFDCRDGKKPSLEVLEWAKKRLSLYQDELMNARNYRPFSNAVIAQQGM